MYFSKRAWWGLFVAACAPAPRSTATPTATATATPTATATATPTPTPTPTAAPPAELHSDDACVADSDCVVVNPRSCCRDCDGTAEAMSKTTLAHHESVCAAVDCDMSHAPVDCGPIVDAHLYRAVCRARRCAGVATRASGLAH